MKYLPLIWAGLWRKRTRTVLTLFSVAVAFLLFGILHAVTASFSDAIGKLSDKRLRTMSSASLLEPIPLADLPEIEQVGGVKTVAYYSIFPVYYRDPKNSLNAGAISTKRFFEAFPQIIVPPDQRKAMLNTRTGALVGEDLAKKYGWHVGDRVPLSSPVIGRKDGARDWTFDVVGIYKVPKDQGTANEFWIDYDYFDQERTTANGTVNFYFEFIDDPSRAAEIAARIDSLFANSPSPTQTQSEKDFVRAQLDRVGNIQYFVNAIIGAVLFTLLFLTGNTMMQSVRERIPELAVLKTYGFGDGTVIALVCAEALLLCGAAAGLGLAGAAAVFPKVFAAIGAPGLPLPWGVVAAGLGIAALLAFVSAAPPAWRIHRLKMVDALAGR